MHIHSMSPADPATMASASAFDAQYADSAGSLAASDDTCTNLVTPARLAASTTARVPCALTCMNCAASTAFMAPATCTTTSASPTSLSRACLSSSAPSTTTAEAGNFLLNRDRSRTSAVMTWSRAASWRTRCDPTNPVTPVTAIRSGARCACREGMVQSLNSRLFSNIGGGNPTGTALFGCHGHGIVNAVRTIHDFNDVTIGKHGFRAGA